MVRNKTLYWAVSLLSSHVASIRGDVSAKSCRNIPQDASWPSSSDWNSLNNTVQGRLLASVPAASVCHLEPFNNYNETACAVLRDTWSLDGPHINSPVEIDAPYFQNQSCDPFTPASQPCELGNYVSYAINVTGVQDVLAGIAFAKEHNVRLVIKNTGHDYVGKNLGKGGLALWTHNLRSTSVVASYASSYYTGPAMKIAAGVLAREAYVAANATGYRVVGGTCPTVGIAGGYTQGGGHSPLSTLYGMAADSVLEWEVVTTDGQHVFARPDNEFKDLYWALSGGGGGTFGVVLSVTKKLYPDGPIGGAALSFDDSVVGNDVFWDAIGAWHASLPALVDVGVGVNFIIENSAFQFMTMIADGKTPDEVTTLLSPFLAELKKRNIPYNFTPNQKPTYLERFNTDQATLPFAEWPIASFESSRLIPRWAVTNSTSNALVISALRNATVGNEFIWFCQALKRPAPDPALGANSVLPAWNQAITLAILSGAWDFTIPRQDMLARGERVTNEIMPQIEAVTPGSGDYLNEANFAQPNWQEQFYGANYDRLVQIKKKYDPDLVLYAPTAVGADSFFIDGDGRVCKA